MTIRRVNRAIRHTNLELVRGEGYHYFVDLTSQSTVGESVMVCCTKHLSLERWVQEAESANLSRPTEPSQPIDTTQPIRLTKP